MEPFDDDLLKDFERVAGRVYSEEGIPMFLVCEDLTSDDGAEQPLPVNHELAAAFRRHTGAWRRMRPDAPLTDAGKIVEVLAHRDFGTGETDEEP